jgi:hypothetical protein
LKKASIASEDCGGRYLLARTVHCHLSTVNNILRNSAPLHANFKYPYPAKFFLGSIRFPDPYSEVVDLSGITNVRSTAQAVAFVLLTRQIKV